MRPLLLPLLLASGCTVSNLMLVCPYDDAPLRLDASTPLGFTASDVLALVGERTYDAAPFDEGDPELSDELYRHGPFTIGVVPGSATAVLRSVDGETIDRCGAERVRLTVDVAIASADGEIDVAGRAYLEATALDTASVAWIVETVKEGARGTLPSWVARHVADDVAAGAWCGVTDVEVDAIDVMVDVHGPLDAPELGVEASWSEKGVCNRGAVMERARLTPRG